MKNFITRYAVPIARRSLLVLILPTIMLGGFISAVYFYQFDIGIYRRVQK
jgi:hypothetical protein